MAQEQKAELIPFAVETLGGFHASASSLIERLHSRARDMGYYWPSDDVFVNVFRRIAVAVQRGNAKLVFESLREKDGS